jgi:hypothetical protein
LIPSHYPRLYIRLIGPNHLLSSDAAENRSNFFFICFFFRDKDRRTSGQVENGALLQMKGLENQPFAFNLIKPAVLSGG